MRIRLRADVPVGTYLIGGLESSAIISIIKNYTGNPLKTFPVSISDKVYDESIEQNEMVRNLGTDYNEVRCTCTYEDTARIIPDVVWHTKIPILRAAPSPLDMLSNLVKKNDY